MSFAKISAEWLISKPSQHLLSTLGSAGFAAFFVGGCVRNTLLGEAVSDLDVATDALPEDVTDLAQEAGFRVVPTGLAHGTVTVLVEAQSFEVTTFRKDVSTDGRHAEVQFSKSLEADARRRDFTMNALYVDREGQVIDPVGGIQDLRDRQIRFIGDARERIQEDYLRILRFFRFHAWYGVPREGFDPDGLAACAAHVDGLDRLSKERIGSELIKLLRAPDPSFAVAGLRQTGALSRILPGADSTLFGQFVAQFKPHDAIARLAFLGGQDPGSALRLSKPQAKRLAQILGEVGSQTPAYELAYRYGAADAHAMLAMRSVLIGPLKFNPDDLVSAASQVFPVSANDLMPNVSGVALGKALRDLEARWIKSDFRLTREELLQGWFH